MVRPAAILPDLPALDVGTVMTAQGEVYTVFMGDHGVQLHSGETRHYIDNLTAAQPSLWVATDGSKVQIVTADPYEGEALASDTERVVEALPMPAQVVARIRAFVATHHVEEVFHKRKRIPATSPDDPRAPRILPQADKWVQSRGKAGQPGKGTR
jgi:hypothetical protein